MPPISRPARRGPAPDPTDYQVSRVHAMLETHIRGERKPLLANLRAFPPRGMINEVWNHGIYKYIATYHAIPGRGPRAVRIVLELHGNAGSMLNGQEDKDRVVFYEYSLVYGMDGRVDESNPYAADWISVGGEAMFAPLNVLEVFESRWAGHNPYVTEANVRSMDLANGGIASGRLAGAPPQFRPVLPVRIRPTGDGRQHSGPGQLTDANQGAASSAILPGTMSRRTAIPSPPFRRWTLLNSVVPDRSVAYHRLRVRPDSGTGHRRAILIRASWLHSGPSSFPATAESITSSHGDVVGCRGCSGFLTQSIRQDPGFGIFVKAVQV